jgi:hypothetical protein
MSDHQLPPLTEIIAPLLDFARATQDRGAESACKVILSETAPYDAELARLREREKLLIKFEALAIEAVHLYHDLGDDKFRSEILSKLTKDSRDTLTDAAACIGRLAALAPKDGSDG